GAAPAQDPERARFLKTADDGHHEAPATIPRGRNCAACGERPHARANRFQFERAGHWAFHRRADGVTMHGAFLAPLPQTVDMITLPDHPFLDKTVLIGGCARLPVRVDVERLQAGGAAIPAEVWLSR